jgi:hypothetical protein
LYVVGFSSWADEKNLVKVAGEKFLAGHQVVE